MKRFLTPIIIAFVLLVAYTALPQGTAQTAREATVSAYKPSVRVIQANTLTPSPEPSESRTERLTRLSYRFARHVRFGQRFGYIDAPRLGLHHWLIREGTTERLLDQGPGHYRGTTVPGAGGTVAIAGHDVTPVAPLPYGPFHWLNRMRPGDKVTITMPYGRFVYTFHRSLIINPDDTSVDKYVGHERLVLSMCWPRYTALHRWVVILWPVQ